MNVNEWSSRTLISNITSLMVCRRGVIHKFIYTKKVCSQVAIIKMFFMAIMSQAVIRKCIYTK